MKRLFLAMLAGMLIAALPTTAQTEKNRQDQKENFGQRFVRLGKKAVKEMEKAANGLGDAIGFEDRVNAQTSDSVKVDGSWYMPLYTVNLYKGGDLDLYRDACRQAFVAKYPSVKVVSVVVPQQEWLSDTYKKNNKPQHKRAYHGSSRHLGKQRLGLLEIILPYVTSTLHCYCIGPGFAFQTGKYFESFIIVLVIVGV